MFLEIKLRLGVDDLVDQLEVLPLQEVGIRLVPGRHGQDLPVELRSDDRSHVVIAAPVAFQLSQLPALELLLETGVVHLVGKLQQALDVPAIALQTAVQVAATALHRLQLSDVVLVLVATELDVTRLSSIEHLLYYTKNHTKRSIIRPNTARGKKSEEYR